MSKRRMIGVLIIFMVILLGYFFIGKYIDAFNKQFEYVAVYTPSNLKILQSISERIDPYYGAVLFVRTYPNNAIVYINRKKHYKNTTVHCVMGLDNNKLYEIAIIKEGYYPVIQVFDTTEKNNIHIECNLLKIK